MKLRLHGEGFTLIEVLVVIIIIGILSAIAGPAFPYQGEKAKDAAVKAGTHSIEVGLAAFAVEHDDMCPAAVADGSALADGGGTGSTLADHMSSGDLVVPKL